METKLTVKFLKKVSEVQRDAWERLLKGDSPFMRWDWLDPLVVTGCVTGRTGWLPQHIVNEKKGKPVAACPMYLKGTSMGEFVFDHECNRGQATFCPEFASVTAQL